MQGFDFSRALIGLQSVGVAHVTVDENWGYVTKDAGLPHAAQAATCKWWAPKVAFDDVQQCLLRGQFGYRTELPIEQRLRDVGLQIGDGTAQIMKLIIARQGVGRALAPAP
jgi:cyclohexanecarboxyl-CoA dehydrogenase